MRTADPELRKKRQLQIIEAASRCFIRKGFHQTSINDICKEAGMSPGGLYRYFNSKDEIIRATSDLETEWLLEEINKLGPKQDVVAALTKTAMDIILAYNEPDQARFIAEIYAESARNPTIGESFAKSDEETRKGLTLILKMEQDEGRISPIFPPKEVAQTIIALVDGFSTRILLDPNFKPGAIEPIIYNLIKSLVRPN